MTRLPWFPFFADDWLNDEAVRIADLATRGAYICLLCHQWREGSIPADKDQVMRLLGAASRDMAEFDESPAVEAAMAFFSPDGNGRLVNQRLKKISDEQVEIREARARAGRSGGKAKAYGLAKPKQSSSIATDLPVAKLKQNLASQSQSHNHNQSQIQIQNQKKEEEVGAGAPSPRYTPEQLAMDWNSAVSVINLPQCRTLTPKRKQTASARLRENGDRAFWLDVIRRITESAFCTGSNERGWRADFEFLIRPDTATRVLEGKYDGRPQGKAEAKMKANLDAARRFIEAGDETKVLP